MTQEIRIDYELIHAIQELGVLPPAAISQTRLLGYSYGGVMAGILSSQSLILDRQANRARTIDGDVTIISPPLHLRRGQRQMDNLINAYEEASLWKKVSSFFGLVHFKDLTADQAKVLMGRNFRAGLASTLLNLKPAATTMKNPEAPLEEIPRLAENFRDVPQTQNSKDFHSFISGLRYEAAMTKYTESDPYWDGPNAKLSDWIRRNQEAGGPEVSMIAARDDVLNIQDQQEFNNFPLSKVAGNLILLEHGGHGGFVYTDWFKDLLAARFGNLK